MSNWFDSSTIKLLYLFGFNQTLWFHCKNLANCFYKLFINKIISSSICIGWCYSLNFIFQYALYYKKTSAKKIFCHERWSNNPTSFFVFRKSNIFFWSMFLISFISETSVIAETLAIPEQLSIVCLLLLQLKYLFSVMSCIMSISEIRDITVIVSWKILDRYKKEVLLLNTVDTQEKLLTALEKILSVVYTIVDNLSFFPIWYITFICL